MKYQCTEKLRRGAGALARVASCARSIGQITHAFRRFRTLRVIFVVRCEQDRAIAVDDVGRGNRQLPTVIAMLEGQVDERAFVECPLFIGYTVGKPELPRHIVAAIGEQREAKLVLITHEEGLLHGLRRNCRERSANPLNLWRDEVHRLHLTHAERTPAAADEAEYEAAFCEQIGGRDGLAVVIWELEFGNLCADGKNIRG